MKEAEASLQFSLLYRECLTVINLTVLLSKNVSPETPKSLLFTVIGTSIEWNEEAWGWSRLLMKKKMMKNEEWFDEKGLFLQKRNMKREVKQSMDSLGSVSFDRTFSTAKQSISSMKKCACLSIFHEKSVSFLQLLGWWTERRESEAGAAWTWLWSLNRFRQASSCSVSRSSYFFLPLLTLHLRHENCCDRDARMIRGWGKRRHQECIVVGRYPNKRKNGRFGRICHCPDSE